MGGHVRTYMQELLQRWISAAFYRLLFSAAHSSRNSFTSLSISLSSIKCTYACGKDYTKNWFTVSNCWKSIYGTHETIGQRIVKRQNFGTNWNSVLFLMAARRRRSQWHNKWIEADSRNKWARYKTHRESLMNLKILAFVFGRHVVAHVGDFLAALSIVRTQRMWVDSVCRLVEMPMKWADNPLECADAFSCFK